jgi:hypothetical protein
MTKAECPVDELELSALLDGELTENRAQRLREHLAGCASCVARTNHLAALAARLRAPVPEALDTGFVDAVERRLSAADLPPPVTRHATRRRHLVLAVSTLAAAAAAITLVALPRARLTSEFTPRGGESPWHARVSTSLAVVPSGAAATTPRPIAAGAALRPGDGIAVTARNGNPDLPIYLMVFAVDAKDEVHWIVPAWADPAQNPRSVLLPPGGALPAPAGRTPEDPAVGKLRLTSLLSRAPLDVRSVEAQLRTHRPLAAADDRHLRTLEVEMLGADARATP